jgi:3-dehydroquinate synthase
LSTVQQLYDRFIEKRVDRRGVVVALGGGIVGDMAEFAAATYLRGVRFVQVPTTLLAMVDSSLGGKTGVDLPEGKNLVGAFKQPDLVVADPEVLGSLSASERTFGMAEVLKHAIIADSWLFSRIEKGNPAVDTMLLLRSIRVKVDVVGDDPWERGRRAILNLGHTFAHAFEKGSDFRLSHGAAVAVGLRASARLGSLVGVTKKGVEERILRALRVCGLPVGFDALSLQRVWEAMQVDKKRMGSRLRFVVPREIGEVVVVEAPDPEAVEGALRSVLLQGSV